MQNRRGETLLDLLTSTVLPIVGGITVGLLLRSFTSLPFGACLLIGIPVGTVAAWLLFVVVAYCSTKPSLNHSRRRGIGANRKFETNTMAVTGCAVLAAVLKWRICS